MPQIIIVVKPPTAINTIGRLGVVYNCSRNGGTSATVLNDQVCYIPNYEEFSDAAAVKAAVVADARAKLEAPEGERVTMFGGPENL